MTGAALQSLAVLHHCLDGIGVEGTSETLCLALDTLHHWNSHTFLGKLGIDFEHLLGTLLCLFACGMSCVALLPKELAGAQKQTSAHLPAHHVAPLVDQQGQVAIGMNPVLEGVPDDGFGGRTDDEFLFESGSGIDHYAIVRLIGLEAIVRHNGTLLCKAFDMLCLTGEEALGDEQGEVGILHASLLEHIVEGALHLLPDCVTVGLDDHTTANITLLSQVGFHHQFIVPFAIVLTPFCEEIQFFCHIIIEDICIKFVEICLQKYKKSSSVAIILHSSFFILHFFIPLHQK